MFDKRKWASFPIGLNPTDQVRKSKIVDDEDFADGWTFEDVKAYMSQPRHPAGSSRGGQWSGGPSARNYGPQMPGENVLGGVSGRVVGKVGDFTYIENEIPHFAKQNLEGVKESYESDRQQAEIFRELSLDHKVTFGEQQIAIEELLTTQSTLRKENLERILSVSMEELSLGSPITAYLLPDGRKVLRDGNHRVAAMKIRGIKEYDFRTISFLKRGS